VPCCRRGGIRCDFLFSVSGARYPGNQETLWSPNKERSGRPCQLPAMPNGRCRMHGGLSPGAPRDNKHALKHGRYTAEEVARRREILGLIRAMRSLAKMSD
jgi:hypothetical protein